MIVAHPSTPEAYQLLHDGALAFSAMEAAGIRIDLAYLDRTIEETRERIAKIEAKLKGMDEFALQRKRFGQEANLTSRPQLAKVLFEDMGLECTKKTKTGRPQLDEDALLATGLNYCKGLLKLEKLNKLHGTYLTGVRREVEPDGFMHPSFNLHTVQTYRGSGSDPNFQNIPIRNQEIGELIRRAFIPRDGHVLVETDFGGHEVRVACNMCQDPKLIDDTLNGDMHRDMAAECFMIEPGEVSKEIRFAAKGMFVFAEFYGDFYKQVAPNLWSQIGLTTKSGAVLEDLLNANGITELGDCSFDAKPRSGTFEAHIAAVENRFWNERYKVYRDWRKMRVNQYRKQGWFDLPTGFVCSGVYAKNQVLNYPIQGAAFHCLLWTVIQLMREIKRKRMRSMVVGQIHDSVVADVHRAELDDYVEMVTRIAQQDIMKAWRWITVPLVIEAEWSETNWWGKKTYQKTEQKKCPTCGSIGFDASALGPDRCSFCDGTEGGNPPDMSACVACGGTGRNSKGGACLPCQRRKETGK